MQHNGGGEAAANTDAAPTKRTRRPSVRLHEPYYENLPGQRKLHRQLNPIKKLSEGVKKPRSVRAPLAKNKKNEGPINAGAGEKLGNFNCDDDVAIGNWKNFSTSNRDRDFKRKRVRPSDSENFASAKSRRVGVEENQNFQLSSDGESEEQGEEEEEEEEVEEEEEEEEEENGEGTNNNLVVENTDLSTPNSSSGGDDDGYDKLSGDDHNVNNKKGIERRGYKNSLDSTEMAGGFRAREGERNGNGVRAWLTELGLQKYNPLFEIHEVDDEVLALLTLDDLKDMGISAVGSRRKMYSSIQKLVKRGS
ncbi:Sterile alpha motif (SAM) domain-containing protein [Striga hermonthica]|uniref:Sterile alpha motif (SAM) domain-containing protein n=1 Tax=Striga hermonthica TaxID=68872 RepID=A0A9N7NMD6_STRHE|nr:Sterile alpha motif (SAM) domain-containing protein [Striga hermonthica]